MPGTTSGGFASSDGWPTPPDATSSTGASVEGDGDDGMFVGPGPDLPPLECSLEDSGAMECPRGEKCNYVPCSSARCYVCRPIVGAQVHGEPCELDPVTLVDDCADGHVCLGLDQRTWTGTCYELCEPDQPCSDGTECNYGGGLYTCSLHCDPTADDCPLQAPVCMQTQYSAGFVCIGWPTSTPGVGEACEDRCAPGLLCAAAGLTGCEAGRKCCAPACDLEAISACDEADGESCLPFFPLGRAPEGFEHVGICATP